MNPLIIMGNGKSILDNDLRKLEYADTFGLNGAFLKYEELGFFPKYYGMFIMGVQKWSTNTIENFIKDNHLKIDKFFVSSLQPDINLEGFSRVIPIKPTYPSHINIDMSKYSLPLNIELDMALNTINREDFDDFGKFILSLKRDELVKLTCEGILNSFYKRELSENDYIKMPRYKSSWIPPISFDNFTFSGGNAGVIACLLGYLMGYKKIILLGVDMKWVADDKIVNTNETYWIPDYFGDQSYDLRDFCSKCTPESINKMHLDAWVNLKEMIEVNSLDLNIVNCSEGSKLDIFRKSMLEIEL